ncbi:MAG: primosomal protein N' [Chlamydia sp.]
MEPSTAASTGMNHLPEQKKGRIAEIILDISIKKRLDYYIPDHLQESIQIGSWVTVPLRNGFRSGCVINIKSESAFSKLSEIKNAIQDGPILTPDLFSLMVWMASYYACPIERVLKAMIPSGVRKGTERKMQYLVMRGKTRDELIRVYRAIAEKAPQQAKALAIMLKVKKSILLTQLLEEAGCQSSSVKALQEKGLLLLEPVRVGEKSILIGEEYFRTKPKILRTEQANALEKIIHSIEADSFQTHLLWGITGSGKTEVYMQAIDRALQLGKSALLLVPEISLTAQTIHRLKSRFSVPIAVLHHRLSDGERKETWSDILQERARIVIGARSAIFSPLPRLGLIIIDEEHESSYKQNDDSPSYHARDIAVMRGKYNNATVVLGSATPSFESFYNSEKGKYSLITLHERSGTHPLPKVHIIDMKLENDKIKGLALFSDLLLTKIDERTKKGEQSILFLNRRGYHTSCICKNCAAVIKCPHCDTALTFHRSSYILACHLCGMEEPPPKSCVICKTDDIIQYRGAGTERVEATLKAILPHTRVLRADLDTTRHKGSLDQILSSFRSGKADVLIGTQMIAKGLHFPEVTLVGIINCDAQLHIPDFRASENVFQLITQVSGRSGRGFEIGEVVLQTSLPDSSVIQKAARQDFLRFYQEEITVRELFGYPPYQHFVKFSFISDNRAEVEMASENFHREIQKILPPEYSVHPSIPAGHAKIKDLWRYQVLVRGAKASLITTLLETVDGNIKLPSSVKRYIDVDPLTTFF